MKFIAIILCKLAIRVGALLGRGSSLPGKIALATDKKILTKLKLPERVMAVTGSNGKTSTVALIKYALERAGLRVVCNSEGSNQTEGVVTALIKASNIKGEVDCDVVLIETDERFAQYTLPQIVPSHLVVLNLFRDQLTRNGNPEFVFGELSRAVLNETMLIYNADDALVSTLAQRCERSRAFGLKNPVYADENGIGAYDDGAYCPRCKNAMRYSKRFYAALGDYECVSCLYSRAELDYAVTGSAGEDILINNSFALRPYIENTLGVYNTLAAFAALCELGLSGQDAVEALRGFTLENGRVSGFSLGSHEGIFLLSKHENSTAYNQSLNYLGNMDTDCTAVIFVNSISRKYVANDMSWIWDVDFERLNKEHIKKIYLVGKFAFDLANRISYTKVDMKRVRVVEDVERAAKELEKDAVGRVVLLTCFSDIGRFERAISSGNEIGRKLK